MYANLFNIHAEPTHTEAPTIIIFYDILHLTKVTNIWYQIMIFLDVKLFRFGMFEHSFIDKDEYRCRQVLGCRNSHRGWWGLANREHRIRTICSTICSTICNTTCSIKCSTACSTTCSTTYITTKETNEY